MNLRTNTRSGCEMFVVREGWQGLVNGNADDANPEQTRLPNPKTGKRTGFVATYGDGELLKEGESEATFRGRYIIQVGWDDVRGFVGEGGTLIGTARCKAFREVEGRRQAAYNLVKHGIDALVVCGGDGSLTGANMLREEWPQHMQELINEGKITPEKYEKHQHLNIVGLVGSIDNDLAGTDLTIGAATALHRICESVDSISSTASSHSRAFVIEVMGRHCGWLAVMAGIATGADHLFIPERPPNTTDWQTQMCNILQKHRDLGKRKSIIIVAEGAIDRQLQPITAELVKQILVERLKLDTRVTTLGHTQRGGRPCAYDRILVRPIIVPSTRASDCINILLQSSLQGIEAIETVLTAKPDSPSYIIGLSENAITRMPMMEAIAKTQEVAKRIAEKDFEGALALRDPEFEECLKAFYASTRIDERFRLPPEEVCANSESLSTLLTLLLLQHLRIGIIQ